MSVKWALCVLLLCASAAFSDEPARLVFSSATDFAEISVTLKSADNPGQDRVEVNVRLSPEAQARTQSTTLLAYQKDLTLYVDGYRLNTARVQGQLGGQFQMFAPRALVIEWMSQFSREAVATQPTM
ncbi:hypothetical protein [Pseudomonas sp.]|uniref:hypothetical protein n=1 Tax=Pseudomonas sp. TaxID=306 RepID=UPI003C5A3E79